MLLLAQTIVAAAFVLTCRAAIHNTDALFRYSNTDEEYDQSPIEQMNYQPSDFNAVQYDNEDAMFDESMLNVEGARTINVDKFSTGTVIRLTYTAPGPLQGSWLLLNLLSGTSDILLHVNPRYYAVGPVLVLNSFVNGAWGTEEVPTGFPFSATNVQVVISVEEGGYRITANGGAFQYFYAHRLSPSLVTSLTSDIDDVQYGAVVSLDSNKVGKVIYVNAVTAGDASAINVIHGLPSQLATPLFTASAPDVALHFNPRFSSNRVVRNTFTNGGWGPEEIAGGFPFTQNSAYIVAITLQRDGYEIAVNGKHFTSYTYRLPLTSPVVVLVTPALLGGNAASVQVF